MILIIIHYSLETIIAVGFKVSKEEEFLLKLQLIHFIQRVILGI